MFALASVLVIGFPFLAILSTSPFSRPGLLRLVSYPLFTLVPAGVYLAFGLAILRYRLWNIQVIINRTLVYTGLTAVVVSIYIAAVGLLSLVFRSEDNWISSILATGLIAVLFHPIRQKLQYTVNRLIYGQRDDPVEMLTHLAERLETVDTSGDALPALVQTVANGLKLPYVALWLPEKEQWKMAADVGKQPGHVEFLPLFYQKQEIGRLVLAPRTPGEAFSSADRRLLGTIAQLAATTIHAIQVTTELRNSRHQIIASREEERRRLRRDLHDGLGPTLATQVIRMETAKDLVQNNPDQAIDLLDGLVEDSRSALDEIRRLVYELRPPALDELGLISALREQAEKYRSAKQNILVDLPLQLPTLPAAVEVALYRIALEALTNVVRHSQAKICELRITLDGSQVNLEVEDDGVGIPPERHYGVGLNSMRERAQELGGDLWIDFQPGHGTKVRACLPVGDQFQFYKKAGRDE